ncbi:ubiquitin-like protein 7 isoform X2 [Myxocyprinus asiaticus]|uniref:ubiquitin-like protein 7 isoform X2 n=1 Tax=Myxocyprinus asiaticus TaxID=70543 RepID=UPI0022235BB2|nr:ubiquitin-like protein 7 isoform X2 [Myxocyprinus asiaticus]
MVMDKFDVTSGNQLLTKSCLTDYLLLYEPITLKREMESSAWHLSLKLSDKPKSVFQFPDAEPGDVHPGRYLVSTLKQLISAQLPDSLPDPDLIDFVHCGCMLKDDLTLDSYGIKCGSTLHILKKTWPEPEVKPEPVNRSVAAREFRMLQAALHSNAVYRDAVFKMLGNKESLDHIIVASPGLSSDPVALGVLQDKDLFVQFTDPNLLDMLIRSHPALVNAIILVLHSVTSSMSNQTSASSSRNVTASSYSEMPGGFLFEGMSDDEEDFPSGNRAGSSRQQRPSAGSRPMTLRHSGATGPRPITQSELASALALASTPEGSGVTPTLGGQEMSSAGPSVPSGAPVTSSLLSQAIQQALQASGVSSVQGRWQSQMQRLRDMGIQDEELALRALTATNGDLQAALELIFAGGGVV